MAGLYKKKFHVQLIWMSLCLNGERKKIKRYRGEWKLISTDTTICHKTLERQTSAKNSNTPKHRLIMSQTNVRKYKVFRNGQQGFFYFVFLKVNFPKAPENVVLNHHYSCASSKIKPLILEIEIQIIIN